MLTYKDLNTGLIFHYNRDLSGDVIICDTKTGQEIHIPGITLRNFTELTTFKIK